MKRPAKYTILFFGCVLFHIAGSRSLPLIDRDEPRFAEASREMLERGDFVVPHFNGDLRLDKPPLTYWAQVVTYQIFGENDFAGRLPSAIAAALIALAIVAWGSRIGGDKVGWWAAIIFTLCFQTFIHAKAAVADMWLALFIALAHWSGFQLLRDGLTSNAMPQLERKSYWLWWSVFYLSLALGFLAKGPIAWVPLLTVASTVFYSRELKLGQRFKFVRGIALMLLVIALWGIPALVRTHGEFLRIGIGRHVVGRSVGAMEGHGWNSWGGYLLLLPFYVVTVFVSLFPWSIKLPSLARKLWRHRDNIDNYLFSGAAIIFIIFSLIKTKLPHYTLPAFAFISILLARHWPQEKGAAFKRIAAGTAIVWITIALVLPPLVAHSFPGYALFQKSREFLRPEMEFGAVDYNEPSLVWYFRSRVKGFVAPLKKKDVAEFMNKDGPRFVVLPSALVPKIFQGLPSNWITLSSRGFNIAKGHSVDLTALIKPE